MGFANACGALEGGCRPRRAKGQDHGPERVDAQGQGGRGQGFGHVVAEGHPGQPGAGFGHGRAALGLDRGLGQTTASLGRRPRARA
jgi:hypothetical protein